MSVQPPGQTDLARRIVDAAIAITLTEDWAGLTMGRLASAVGVSRQTVYNEVGAKPQLAELIVLTEAAKFLHVVNVAFDSYEPDYVSALRQAIEQVLQMGEHNALLRSIIGTVNMTGIAGASHGAQTALLPLLTTRSHGLLAASTQVVAERLRRCQIPMERAEVVSEFIVRLVLSYLMQPGESSEESAALIVAVAAPALDA
jgi:AcrR family transcriptional regulator